MTLRAPLRTRIERRSSRAILNSQREVSSNRLLNLLSGQDQFFGVAGLAPKYDYPNPRGKRYPSHLRTFTSQYRNQWWYNPATEQYVIAVAGPYDAYSMLDDANSAAGNILVTTLVWSPSGNALSVGTDGIPYMVAPATGRQSATYREWSLATNNWVVVTGAVDGITATYYINNAAPTAVGTIPNQNAYIGVVYEGPILDDYISDAEGDAITWTVVSGTLPTGISIQTVTLNSGQPDERTVKRLRGTPAVGQEGVDTIGLRGTDIVGDFVNLATFDLTTILLVTMPDVDDGTYTLAIGRALIEAEPLLGAITVQYVASVVTVGNIASTVPDGGAFVSPGTPVTINVSGDGAPAAFAFTDQTGVALSTVIISDSITVSGINVSTAISVSNGEYSIDGGTFTSVTGTIANASMVRVRQTSSDDYSTVTETILNIGGVTDTFSSTTAAVIAPSIARIYFTIRESKTDLRIL